MIILVNIWLLLTSVLTFYGIYLILALSFNLEFGFTGQPNFGKVFFYSIGAYVAGYFTTHGLLYMAGVSGVPFFSATADDIRLRFATSHPGVTVGLFFGSLLLAAVVGGIVGYLASYPALRLKEDYLAIMLLGIGEMGRIFFRTYEPVVGGVYGVGGIANPLIWLGDPRIIRVLYCIIVLAIALIIYILINELVNSPYGRKLKSIRDNILVSDVLGKKTARVKGQVFIIGSAAAAVAGALYAFYLQTVYANDFIVLLTFIVIMMVMLGGVANNKGVVLGALIVTLFYRFTRASFFKIFGITFTFDITYVRYIIIGALIILVLIFKPEGLVPEKPVKTPAFKIAEKSR